MVKQVWQRLVMVLVIAGSLALAQGAVAQGMTLDNERSSLAFTTTKNGAVTEVHTFKGLSGSIVRAGQAEVTIDLVTVATGIDIRDERMRKMLFETEQFGKATFTADVSQIISDVRKSSSKVVTLEGELNLHGQTKPLAIEVLVSHGKQSWVVSTVKPVLIKADDFDLGGGVEKLREIAGLSTISPMVPVSFVLTFDR